MSRNCDKSQPGGSDVARKNAGFHIKPSPPKNQHCYSHKVTRVWSFPLLFSNTDEDSGNCSREDRGSVAAGSHGEVIWHAHPPDRWDVIGTIPHWWNEQSFDFHVFYCSEFYVTDNELKTFANNTVIVCLFHCKRQILVLSFDFHVFCFSLKLNVLGGLVNFASWNVKSLNHPMKCRKVLTYLNHLKADIAFLHPSIPPHLHTAGQFRLRGRWIGQAFQLWLQGDGSSGPSVRVYHL